MDKNLPLLAVSYRDSSLLMFGAVPEIGKQSTKLHLQDSVEDIQISVLGSSLDAADGEIELKAPLLVEHAHYDIYLRGPNPRQLHTAPQAGTIKLRYQSADISHYTLNYGSAVGDVSWLWRTPDRDIVIDLEVFPTKLDYREDFTAIKRDLGRLSRLLIADIAGATGTGFAAVAQPQEAQAEWVEQVRREASSLRESMAVLLPRLREQVRPAESVARADRLRGRKPARRRDSALLALGLAHSTVTVASAELSVATAVNGYLKWEVDRLISAGQQTLNAEWFTAAGIPLQDIITHTVAAAWEWRKELATIPPVPRLPHLQTRLRDPLYAKAFVSLRRLRLGLEEDQGPELLGLKNIWLLYEYWIYLQLVNLLKARYPIVTAASPSLVREIGGQIHLVKGVESRITLRDSAGEAVTCFYNRAFINLPTTGQRPDITIEFLPSHELLLVDAKYRLARTPRYLERYGMPGPEEDDINVLHRYRDAIVELHHLDKKRVVGGLIAFPGPEQDKYRMHRFFQSWGKVRIAGIPMLPGRIDLMGEVLDDQILRKNQNHSL